MYSNRKLLIAGLAVLLIFLTVFPGAVPGRAENEEEPLLYNGDFAVLDEEGIPDGWYTDAYILDPGYTLFRMTEEEGEDSKAHVLEISNLGMNDARLAQLVDVEPDTLYKFSGWIRAENVSGGLGANLSVEGLYAFSESVFDTEGEWQYVEWYGETGSDQYDVTLFARLGGYSGECTGKAWFKDLRLEEVNEVPGDGIAARWFSPEDYSYYDEEGDEAEEEEAAPFWPFLLVIGILYTAVFIGLVNYLEQQKTAELRREKFPWAAAAAVFVLAMAFRCVLSAKVAGYGVDVNDFRVWGNMMLSGGPGQFYVQSGFCDYPPAYTWVLGLNAWLCRTLNASEETARVIYRFIPNLCDVAACGLLAGFAWRKRKTANARSALLLFACLAFHPATVLNSAAWGQMDSVLCLLLLIVVLLAVEDHWAAALPVYMLSVLVKPQALMLGFLGLEAIVLRWIGNPKVRKPMLIGVGISLAVAAVVVIPFGVNQSFGWLIRLYGSTLGSYPYATINTANLYYLLGGNWQGIANRAPVLLPLLLAAGCGAYGFVWFRMNREKPFPRYLVETVISGLFAVAFLVLAVIGADWSLCGTVAMAFAFVIVLSLYLRKNDLRFLPYLGGLLFILLYVFGLKMHERYLFPALLLMAAAWLLYRDRRILWVLAAIGLPLFINEGIILDNCIRLGASYGHLNADTVWLADILAVIHGLTAVYAVWLGLELCFGREAAAESRLKAFLPVRKVSRVRSPLDYHPDASLHWSWKDTVILSVITVIYSVISLTTLGSTKAPQTTWSSTSYNENVIFDLGEDHEPAHMLYFGQVSRHDFSLSQCTNLENWSEEVWAEMKEGQCWKWQYVTSSWETSDGERFFSTGSMGSVLMFTTRYVRLTAQQVGLRLNEVIFRTQEGEILPVTIVGWNGAVEESELYSDPAALLDEQDSLEGLPDLFSSEEEKAAAMAQPSWWNSSYFDEIYHARTAWEFTQRIAPYETSHPPLGKVLMSWAISLMGMTPFGWRFAGALAGILMLPGLYLIGKQLTGKTRYGMAACLLMALDCMHLTQTQIATIDSFPVLFILFAYFFMLRFMKMNLLTEKKSRLLLNLLLCGVCMGLAIASKWIGIYAGLGLAVMFFWHCGRTVRLRLEAERLAAEDANPVTGTKNLADEAAPAAGAAGTGETGLTAAERERLAPWLKKTAKGMPADLDRILRLCLWCQLFFIIIPLGIYLASYIPYMAYNHSIKGFGGYLKAVWDSQLSMLSYHSTPGLGMDHPFYSPWYEWPVIGKPMFYATEQYMQDNGLHTSIFCAGNPAIWWAALGAVAICVLIWVWQKHYEVAGFEQRWHLGNSDFTFEYGFLLISLLAQYLPWVLVPRGTYIYHYFACVPFLVLALCLCFDTLEARWKKTAVILLAVYLVLSAVGFAVFFPYASGILAPESWLDIGRQIIRVWY